MRADVTPVVPAFRRNIHAITFVAIIFFLASLPTLIDTYCRVSIKERMRNLKSDFYFDTEQAYQEVFEKKSEIDILIIGGCQIVGALDPTALRERLAVAGKTNGTVVVLGANLVCQDLSFYLLKELLQRRRVHLVILQSPPPDSQLLLPNPSAVLWHDDSSMFDGVPIKWRLAMQAQQVMDGLRTLLSLVRPNLTQNQATRMADFAVMRRGYRRPGAPRENFVDFAPPTSEPSSGSLFYRTNPDQFAFLDQPLGDYQMRFLQETFGLLHRQKIPFVMLHVPALTESGAKVPERLYWPEIAKPCELMGMPFDKLFKRLSPDQIKLLYQDERHFNLNGRRLFSNSVCGGLVDAYTKHHSQ